MSGRAAGGATGGSTGAAIGGDTTIAVGTNPPPGWTRGAAAWNAHRAACAARYRTYDPITDTYFARVGVQARCRL